MACAHTNMVHILMKANNIHVNVSSFSLLALTHRVVFELGSHLSIPFTLDCAERLLLFWGKDFCHNLILFTTVERLQNATRSVWLTEKQNKSCVHTTVYVYMCNDCMHQECCDKLKYIHPIISRTSTDRRKSKIVYFTFTRWQHSHNNHHGTIFAHLGQL